LQSLLRVIAGMPGLRSGSTVTFGMVRLRLMGRITIVIDRRIVIPPSLLENDLVPIFGPTSYACS
jgi:hypothetical protein